MKCIDPNDWKKIISLGISGLKNQNLAPALKDPNRGVAKCYSHVVYDVCVCDLSK